METKTITYKIISCEKRPCNPTIGHFEVARVIIEAQMENNMLEYQLR